MLTPRAAISQAPTTVLPKAVAALSTPQSQARIASAASLWASVSSPCEGRLKRLAGAALVVELHRDAILLQQREHIS